MKDKNAATLAYALERLLLNIDTAVELIDELLKHEEFCDWTISYLESLKASAAYVKPWIEKERRLHCSNSNEGKESKDGFHRVDECGRIEAKAKEGGAE